MSLIVVLTAVPARLVSVPFGDLAPYWYVVVNLLAGSLVGAWIGATWATRMRSATLYRVIAVLLVFIAAALATTHLAQVGTLDLPPVPRTILGFPLPELRLLVIGTHMHYVGREMSIRVERETTANGDPPSECLIATPEWNFNWQRGYQYDVPIDKLPRLQGVAEARD